jgi:hypothetical protein
MVKSAWYDTATHGRMLNAIFKDCNKKYWKYEATNHEMAESYFDRMMKVQKVMEPLRAEYTGVKKLIKSGSKIEVSPECLS